VALLERAPTGIANSPLGDSCTGKRRHMGKCRERHPDRALAPGVIDAVNDPALP